MQNIWGVSQLGYSFPQADVEASRSGEILKAYLETLISYGLCDFSDGSYVINHKNAADLSVDDKELLGLPVQFPYQISVTDSKGDLGHKDFRYAIRLLKPDGTFFVNPEIIGSYVKIDGEREYIFDKYQYSIVDLAVNCNKTVSAMSDNAKANHFNLLNVVKMQEYGMKADAVISKHIEDAEVVVPDRLSVDFEKNKINGRFYAKPVLLKKSEIGEDFEVIDSKTFKDSFDGISEVRSVYFGSDGKKYVFNDEVKRGLDAIKKTKPLKKAEYERFCVQPREMFDDEVFAFPEGLYSDRVTDFTTVKYKGYSIEGLNEGGWLPEEGFSESAGFKVTAENVGEVEQKIKEAEERGRDYIEIGGQVIPINKKLKNDVKNIRRATKGTEDVPEEGKKDEPKRYVLDVKKNDEILDYMSKNKTRADISKLISGLKTGISLYDHQLAGVSWIYNQWCEGYKGVLLADDMGLGKTLQTLAFISGIMKTFPELVFNPILIVAPVSLLKNWKNEILQFVNSDVYEDIVELHSSNLRNFKINGKLDLSKFAESHKRCIVQTTYETLRDHQLDFGLVPWSIIIVDEAQKIKNPSASQTCAIKGMKYDFAIALSGTPVENTWIDLWSIMDFAQPGKLGNFKWFKEEYHNKLKENKHNIDYIQELGGRLQVQLSPLFLRRLKKDHIKGLPVKKTELCPCAMPKKQSEAYLNAIESYKNFGGHGFEIIAKLRDISLHPDLAEIQVKALADVDIDSIINDSARLKKTFDILREIQLKKEKVLIFVVSKKMQLILQYLIHKKFGISVATPINGDMNGDKRQDVIDEFEDKDGFGVLILSPEAAGVGLNITCANHVIHLSRTWNPAKEDQATDRAYRIGQTKDVTVYIPMAICEACGENGSFDEKIDKLLTFKRTLSENVLFPTPESKDDYEEILNGLGSTTTTGRDYIYYDIDDMKGVTGSFFEKVLRQLYENMGYDAVKTPDSNDRGADVLAWDDTSRKKGLLIQSKQTSTDDNMNGDGIQEVVAALGYYEKKYPGCIWQLMVITNAKDFTAGAKELAADNNVKLITRKELARLFNNYKVRKF